MGPLLLSLIILVIIFANKGSFASKIAKRRRLKTKGKVSSSRGKSRGSGSGGSYSDDDNYSEIDLDDGSSGSSDSGGSSDDTYDGSDSTSGDDSSCLFIFEVVEDNQVSNVETYSPVQRICNNDENRRSALEIEGLRVLPYWEDLASALCSPFNSNLSQKNREFEVSTKKWYINKLSIDAQNNNQTRVVNTTTFTSWQVSMNVFIANATSSDLSAGGSTQWGIYDQLSLQEAILFTIADQPNNSSEGKLGVAFYEPAIESSSFFQALAEEDKGNFYTCSLPDFNSSFSVSNESVADVSVAFTLSSFQSLEAVYQALDRLTLALLYGRGDRRLTGRKFNRDATNLFTKTSQLSAQLYSDALSDSGGASADDDVEEDLMMKTAVVCGDQDCAYIVDGSPSAAPSAAPTTSMPISMPTSLPTSVDASSSGDVESALDIAAECGIICDSLARSNRLWSIYDARYGDASTKESSRNASTAENNASGSVSSTRVSIYSSSLEVRASVYLVWLCLLVVAWVAVLMAWVVKMCGGYAKCSEVCRLKLCSSTAVSGALSGASLYYLGRNLAVTCSGGGVYAPEAHDYDNAPERTHGYGLSLPVLRLMQSAVVLVIILTRLAYIGLLLLGTLERHLPSFVCMELAPYGFGLSAVEGHDGFSLSSMASPVVLISAASFFPLFLVGMALRRAMTLQLMRLLNLGYLTSAPPAELSATDEEEGTQVSGLRSTELPVVFRAAIVQAFAVGFGGIGALSSLLMMSALPSTREAISSLTVQPVCLAVIMAAAASAVLLQLTLSPCWMPRVHSLLTARLQRENLRRRDSLIFALSSMYSDDGRHYHNSSAVHTRSRAGSESTTNYYMRTADESGHNDDLPTGGGRAPTVTGMSVVAFPRPTSRHSVSMLVDDSFVGVVFTVMAITAVVATATTGYAWGSLLMYSGALRILEVFTTALLLREMYTKRNSFRSKLLSKIRDRNRDQDSEREREERQSSGAA